MIADSGKPVGSHRRGWIDYSRGVVIIYVVYRHAMIGLIGAGVSLNNAVYLVQEVSMPVFFIVSGLFIGSSTLKRGLGEFVSFKVKSLLYPYFVWGFIHLTIQILFSHYSNSDKSTIYYLYLFIAPRAIDQFWYLYTLFFSMIIFAILNFKILKFKIIPNVLVAIVFCIASYFFKSLWFSITDILFYFLFLVVGFLLSDFVLPSDSKFFRGRWLFIALPIFIGIQLYWWMHYPDVDRLVDLDYVGFMLFIPVTILSALLLFIFSQKLEQWKILKPLRYIGSHSLYIYIMHLIFTASIRVFIMRIFPGLPPLAMLGIVIAGGVFLPIVCYRLIVKLNLNFLLEPPDSFKKFLFWNKPQ
ncbi:MAG: acyltransferase [Cyclobacteriaceae bacterium]